MINVYIKVIKMINISSMEWGMMVARKPHQIMISEILDKMVPHVNGTAGKLAELKKYHAFKYFKDAETLESLRGRDNEQDRDSRHDKPFTGMEITSCVTTGETYTCRVG